MEQLHEGMIYDMIVESANDRETYSQLPSQADFDNF
jgi:hypothetical protein